MANSALLADIQSQYAPRVLHFSAFHSSGSDFSSGTINITIPANRMSFEIQTLFSVIDDDINEFQQSFAIIADIIDVPENISCFQRAFGERICHGRRGATAIRITDNDREF